MNSAGRGPACSWPDELAYDVLEVGHLLSAFVLGVRPLAPGWKAVPVAPQPVDLAVGSAPLPDAGVVAVAWQRDGDALSVRVEAPKGVAAEVRVPEGFRGDARVDYL